jgi:hypothetical protein
MSNDGGLMFKKSKDVADKELEYYLELPGNKIVFDFQDKLKIEDRFQVLIEEGYCEHLK